MLKINVGNPNEAVLFRQVIRWIFQPRAIHLLSLIHFQMMKQEAMIRRLLLLAVTPILPVVEAAEI